MDELIIIGAGPMGIYAGFAAGLRDIRGRILESSYTFGGQVSMLYGEKRIYDIPGFNMLKGNEFIDKLYNQYLKYQDNFPIELETEVIEIIKENEYFLVNTNKGSYKSKKILITDGGGKFTPKKLECKGVFDQENILYNVKKIDDLKNKKIAILGGGDSAVDWALMLVDVASEIFLIHRRDNFRAHAATLNEYIAKKGNVLTPYIVDSVIGSNKVKTLVLKNNKDDSFKNLDIDYILVFYGVDNTKGTFINSNIKKDKTGIIVEPNMKTNIDGIFAAGNCVNYEGKLNMIVTGMGEVATAIGQITNELYPNRKSNNVYSSLLFKE